jgi:hypothetical protein
MLKVCEVECEVECEVCGERARSVCGECVRGVCVGSECEMAVKKFLVLCRDGRLEEARGLISSHPTLDIHA